MAPRAVLIGLPGVGKSTVGRQLAATLDIPFADSDDLVEQLAGRSVPEIFEQDGEPAFRRWEAEAILQALAGFDGVLALGGGAVGTSEVRHGLEDSPAPVLLLTAGLADLLDRVGHTQHRPLLAGDPAARLAELAATREPLYRQLATVDCDTSGRPVEQVVAELAARLGPTRIEVTGDRPYRVVIGAGVLAELAGLLTTADRVAIVHQPVLAERATELAEALSHTGHRTVLLPIPDGEDGKTLEVAGSCFDRLAAAGFTRSDAVVGLGGGASTDLAGWVAASWLRGVPVVQLPSTLAGMVDAAIGGKTGINLAAGKNLVGAFHPPVGVLCDLSLLATLPSADYRAGLAEVVKCGFIADPAILDLIEDEPERAATPGSPVERELIERSVAVKAGVVSADLTEQGLREVLNYGHTLGHAIEHAERYRWRHGAAVSVGLVFAAELARELGRLDAGTADRHRSLLASLGLPVSYRRGAFDELVATMRLDKKARGDRLRFVLLDGLARPVTVDDPDPEAVRRAYARVEMT